jgi:peptidylprolyl isomerase
MVYRVKYTGWFAADGRKFDSSDDHPAEPVYDSSLKQVKEADGKPKMEAGQPILFMQGRPGMIPGWDLGFDGIHVGGKRRLFIPYQMAYGELGRPSADPKHPGIPPKADLIFDIELVEMMEPPAQPTPPARPGMPPHPAPVAPHPGAGMPPNAAPTQPAAPAPPASTTAPAQPSTPAQPAKPPQSSAPAQPATPAQPSTPTTAPAQPQPK